MINYVCVYIYVTLDHKTSHYVWPIQCIFGYCYKYTQRLMTGFVVQGHIYRECCEKVVPPSCFFLFFAYLSNLKDSDHQQMLILHKDNASKNKMQFLNVDFIYYKVIKPFLRLWDSSEPRSEPLSTNGENLEQWWPSRSDQPTNLLQECNDDSSRRS